MVLCARKNIYLASEKTQGLTQFNKNIVDFLGIFRYLVLDFQKWFFLVN